MFLEIAPASVEAAANHGFWHIMPTYRDPLPDAIDGHFRAWQAQIKQTDEVVQPLPDRNGARVGKPAQSGLEREASSGRDMFVDCFEQQSASPRPAAMEFLVSLGPAKMNILLPTILSLTLGFFE